MAAAPAVLAVLANAVEQEAVCLRTVHGLAAGEQIALRTLEVLWHERIEPVRQATGLTLVLCDGEGDNNIREGLPGAVGNPLEPG